MINKVELGSVDSRIKTSRGSVNQGLSFSGAPKLQNIKHKVLESALGAVQECEKNPMINVAVLDLSTAIIPRTIFETVTGSKQKDEEGNEKEGRKLNFLAGFEALRREGSGLLINCMIPGAIVVGASKLLNRPVMGGFSKSNLTTSWANSDAIDVVSKYYKNAKQTSKEERVYATLKSMFDDIEGVDGDIDKNGLKQFKQIFEGDKQYEKTLREMTKNILSDNPEKGYANKLYEYMVQKTRISENIRLKGQEGFLTSSLGHLCNSASEILHGASKEGLLNGFKDGEAVVAQTGFEKYVSKAKKLVNMKSIAGLGIIIPLAIAAQPINRWITHKISGKQGAPIYNDDKERILTPEEKTSLTAKKFVAVPLMWATAGLSMLMDRPSLRMFQFKNIFPTMDQARIISAATFSSRLAAAEDENELFENTVRDIATFSSFYFLGDYAAKGIATYLEKHNKDGIKLINRLKTPAKDANILQKFWNWAKHTKMKSTDELGGIADTTMRAKAKNLRALCQLGNLAFSLLSLGVFIPLYTRTQTNKNEKKSKENEQNASIQSPIDISSDIKLKRDYETK